MVFEEGFFFVSCRETLLDSLPPARFPLEVATARKFERTDPAPAVTTGNFQAHSGNVSLGPILIAERLVAAATGPLLRFLVEVRLRLTADVGAGCVDRGGGGGRRRCAQ